MNDINYWLFILAGYLIGGIPFGFLIGKGGSAQSGGKIPVLLMASMTGGGGMIRSEVNGRITASDPSETVWFTAKHTSYENRDYEIPVDTHFLNALIADRPLYISMGDSDLASDPYSTYDAFRFAGAVWKEIYGIEVLPEMDYFDLEPGKEYFSAGQGLHLHRGAHSMTWEDDWIHFVNYVEYLKKLNK